MGNRKETNISSHSFLIVNDKSFLRSLIHRMLGQSQAAEVKHAKNGESAIEALDNFRGKIDCALCDGNTEPRNDVQLLKSI